MKFLKDNLFLICTVAAAVLGGGALLALARSASEKAEGYAKQRTDQSQKIARLGREGVNEKIVSDAQQRVALIDDSALGVAEYCLQRSRGQYEIITFDVGGKKIEAFPIDAEVYAKESLRWVFPAEYKNRQGALLTPLNATMPPGREDTDEEIRKLTGQEPPSGGGRPSLPMIRTEMPNVLMPPPAAMRGPLMPSNVRTGQAGPDPRGRRDVRTGSGAVRYGPGTYLTRTPTTRPGTGEGEGPAEISMEDKVTRRLVLEKSRKGWIYADVDSLYQPAVLMSAEYNDVDLWMAQLSLWIQNDLLAAINKTNREAQQNAPAEKEKGVASSAVKRLLEIGIRDYVMKPAAGSGTRKGLRGVGTTAEESAQPSLQYLNPGNWGMPPTLTGRACNELYDVVHYDFKVILPAGSLRDLYENIRLQNFHTILEVEITHPSAQGRMESRKLSEESYFYYGTESVVQANIVGELVMLSDWTRGRWDAKQNKWDQKYPPLVPEKLLETMYGKDPKALRDQDKTRAKISAVAAPVTDRRAGGPPLPVRGGRARAGADAGPAARPDGRPVRRR